MSNESILNKIKKCFALSKSDNEHEAAQALKHAQALMRKHNIDASALEASEVNSISSRITKVSLEGWHFLLIHTVEEVFSVVAEVKYSRIDGYFVKFTGRNQNAEIAKYAYDTLFKQCNRMRTQYIKINLKRVRKPSHKTLRANEYAKGVVSSVYWTVFEFFTDADRAEREAVRKIMYPDSDNRTPVPAEDTKTPAIKKVKKKKGVDCSRDGEAGLRDGADVKLFKPVAQQQSQRVIHG